MKKIKLASRVLSLAALLSTGCASRPYTKVQLGYAQGQHKIGTDGHVDLICVRARGGATVAEKHLFQMGADLCYGKLPKTTSEKRYSVEVPVVGKQEADVHGTTKNNLVKISIPFLEYRLGALEADFPSKVPTDLGIRSPTAKDISFSIWAAGGYDIEILASETNYTSSGGTLNNIPGIDLQGKFYGEISHEITFFGKVPLTLSIRIPEDGKVIPLLFGGYKLQWK